MSTCHGTQGRSFSFRGTKKTVTGFGKTYKNSSLSFLALLPKQEGEKALWEALNRLDFSSLRGSEAIVRTRMPEFRLEFTKELTGLCKALGIKELFTDDADFSPMTSEWLKVDSILHKAYIDVNQKGTKAAAVTVAYCVGGLPPKMNFKEVYLDRPFVFALMHGVTRLPVFIGVVRHLDDAKQDPERLKRKLGRARRLRMESAR